MMRASIKFYLLILLLGLIVYVIVLLYFNSLTNIKDLSDNEDFRSFSKRVDSLETMVEKQLMESHLILERIKSQFDSKDNLIPGNSKEPMLIKPAVNLDKPVIAILVIACNRITVKRCLDNLIKYRPNKDQYPIIVSQDCNHEPTYQAILEYVTPGSGVTVTRQPNNTKVAPPKAKKKLVGYYYISRHYKYALEYVFTDYEQAIIVEDDLDISSDFFEYFSSTLPLLIEDETLWCVSAWNDNGKRGLIDETASDVLYRTDFFPGLGWMLRKDTAQELLQKWPLAFWDDWVRDPKQTRGRACIRPEISRTITFGKVGVSMGLYFDKHLKHILLNERFVHFSKTDLSYLLKHKYDPWFDGMVAETPAMTLEQIKNTNLRGESAKFIYKDSASFKKAAKSFGLMDDFRSGVPRTAYRGVVTVYTNGARVYIARENPVTEYNVTWS